eukprot:CAMPEP_0114979892 /NCGR_PEP_ID=MMETSP0216-20121206/4641_1 /TAXON_ID=223996 /ORGANISM="Protocruzia adherens, Strain Boccale" /LENGTH=158 /DNA_ID=CAMNT_0002341303 /DNA_START=519 /DNA_END=995 /DNA_ORIENTATION=+
MVAAADLSHRIGVWSKKDGSFKGYFPTLSVKSSLGSKVLKFSPSDQNLWLGLGSGIHKWDYRKSRSNVKTQRLIEEEGDINSIKFSPKTQRVYVGQPQIIIIVDSSDLLILNKITKPTHCYGRQFALHPEEFKVMMVMHGKAKLCELRFGAHLDFCVT